MLYRVMAGRLPFDVSGFGLVEAAQRILHTDVVPLGSIDLAICRFYRTRDPAQWIRIATAAISPRPIWQRTIGLTSGLVIVLDATTGTSLVAIHGDG